MDRASSWVQLADLNDEIATAELVGEDGSEFERLRNALWAYLNGEG